MIQKSRNPAKVAFILFTIVFLALSIVLVRADTVEEVQTRIDEAVAQKAEFEEMMLDEAAISDRVASMDEDQVRQALEQFIAQYQKSVLDLINERVAKLETLKLHTEFITAKPVVTESNNEHIAFDIVDNQYDLTLDITCPDLSKPLGLGAVASYSFKQQATIGLYASYDLFKLIRITLAPFVSFPTLDGGISIGLGILF